MDGDAELLSGCARSDKRSWDAFVDKYSKLVYWSIWKALESRTVPSKEDFCRETFQELFRRLLEPGRMAALGDVQHLPKYLQVCAANLVFERLRRSSASDKKQVPLDEVAWDEPSRDEGVSSLLERAEALSLLKEALGTLGPKETACLKLHYASGRTHREIGLLLGLPQDTVSTILRRVKDKLRQRLEEKGLAG